MNPFLRKIISFHLFIIVFFWLKITCRSFIYPVSYDCFNNLIYIIHQKSINNLNLWLWNPETNSLQRGLISNFTPGGIKLLPGNRSFSFMDQGRIRIKDFQKRSPKTVEFLEPLCDMNIIEWQDEENFYFSARKNKNFLICLTNKKLSKINILAQKDHADCIYPQIISDYLYYIERENVDDDINLCRSKYKIIKKNLITKEEQIILDNGYRSIAFLYVSSQNDCYYLVHPVCIERKEKIISFDYHNLYEFDQHWLDKTLFSFKLPISLIFGSNDERLYESILRLLPKHYKKTIFYSNLTDNSNIDIYSYDLDKNAINQRTKSLENQIYFSPIFINNRCFYGYSVDEDIYIDDSKTDPILPFTNID